MDTTEKPKRGHHPNSSKNLKKFPPNNNANPLGAGAHDPVKRALKKFGNDYVKEIIEIAMMGELKDLAEIFNNPGPALRRGLAKAVYDAATNGNWPMLERIFERVLGKIPERIEHTVNDTIPLTKEEIHEQLAKLGAARKS
jgi:hypothetical protein